MKHIIILKSRAMPAINTVHIFIKLILVISVTFCINQTENIKNQLDLPFEEDLKYLIVSLQKAIEYMATIQSNGCNLQYVAFGFQFVAANLKSAMLDRKNYMPISLQNQVTDLIEKSERGVSSIVDSYKHPNCTDSMRNFYFMFLEEISTDVWIERMRRVDAMPPPPLDTRRSYRPVIYNSTNVLSGVVCAKSLLGNIKYVMGEPLCSSNKECYNYLISDEQYYNQLTHRIVTLVLARFARGCAMFSVDEDRQMLARYCAIVYNEFGVIFLNEKAFIGRLFQNMALCLFAGHREFHRRAIYNKVMKYQQRQGCFTIVKPKRKNLYQKSAEALSQRWASTFLDDQPEVKCHPYDMSSEAAAYLSAGVRFMFNGEVDK